MKINSFKRLWGVALGFILLASAVPFTAFAQTGMNAGPGGINAFPAFGPAREKPVDIFWEEGILQHRIRLFGNFRGSGTFVFEGSTISYRHESGEYPTVRVNERNWGVPNRPFELPFEIDTADFELKQIEGSHPVKVTKVSDKKFEVYFTDPKAPAGSSAANYIVSIAPEKPLKSISDPVPVAAYSNRNANTSQLPIPYQKLSNGDTVFVRGIPPGPSEEERYRDQVWDDCRKMREVILAGKFKGSGTFVFEGDTITYRHESGEYPIMTVNARTWGDKNWAIGIPTKPFVLPFRIETAQFVLKQTEGDEPVKVTKVSDRKFEVYFKAPKKTSEGESVRYEVTIDPESRTFESAKITPGKQLESK